MLFNKTKWVTLTVALCFAILQALQPFIHAHLDSDHPIQHTGFHVGDEHEEQLQAGDALSDHSLNTLAHASHTISVSSAIKQDIDPALVLNIVGFIVVSLCLAFILQLASQQFFQANPSPYHSLKRRLPAARAPPQY